MCNLKAKVTTAGAILLAIFALAQLSSGCGGLAGVFNPAFVNQFAGGGFPVTPGPNAAFVLVRVVNETTQTAEFIVTIERLVIETDEDGNFLIDEGGNPVTRAERETMQLDTLADAPANESGVLFDCSQSPVTKVGLGENLLPTDAAVFIGGGGPAGSPGFGIPAENLNPLLLEVGNFNCGDTIIFRAFQSIGVPGGVAVQVFLLPGSEQPSGFRGPNTFETYSDVLESQAREGEP